MTLGSKDKKNLVIAFSFLWAIVITLLPFVSVLFDTRFVSIWAGVAFFYFTYKFSMKPNGEKSFSFLTFWYFFITISSLALAAAEIIENSDFIYFLLIPVSALHFFLGKWSYHIPIDQKVLLPGLNQEHFNYEVINFDLTRELISKVHDGDTNALTSGEYKQEVSDAAIQAMSEEILLDTLKKIKILNGIEPEKSHHIELLKKLIHELDDESKYQLYPLWADRAAYLEYFYEDDLKLRQLVISALDEIDTSLTLDCRKDEYFENNPCAANWPIISKFTIRKESV